MQVNLDMYDSANVKTTVVANAKKYVYTIILMKRINGVSFSSYTVVPYGSITSTVTVMPPYGASGIKSSAPLSGFFVITCPDPSGKIFKTRPKGYNRNIEDVMADFEEDISWLRGRVWLTSNINGQLSDNFKFNYRENGVSINLIFDGLNSNPPQCTIGSD